MRGLAHGERPPAGSAAEETVFAKALVALPIALLALSLPLLAWSTRLPRMRSVGDPAR